MKKHLLIILILVVAAGAGLLVLRDLDKTESSNVNNQTLARLDSARLANPASVNCEKVGGNLVIKTNGSGGQYGLCEFEDNQACEEWALFRGDCPVGGVKTTGYDNIEQQYCAWAGGQTLAVANASCTLPDGTICSVNAYYNGTCPQY